MLLTCCVRAVHLLLLSCPPVCFPGLPGSLPGCFFCLRMYQACWPVLNLPGRHVFVNVSSVLAGFEKMRDHADRAFSPKIPYIIGRSTQIHMFACLSQRPKRLRHPQKMASREAPGEPREAPGMTQKGNHKSSKLTASSQQVNSKLTTS